MAKQDDGLFLLEVLVEKVVFLKSPCFSDKVFRTCVNIEAPSVEPLEICDDDPGVCVASSGGPFVNTFNNGKSCLFSMKEVNIGQAMSSFPIKVSVYKCLPCGCFPTKVILGEATIDMTKEFVEARKRFLEDPTAVSYQALKDSFRIVGQDGVENGEIVMFMRISCFGKLIITRFQGTGGPPNLGAGRGSPVVDRSCDPRRDFQTTRDPCVCGSARGAAAGTAYVPGPPCLAGGSAVGAGTHSVGPCPLARDIYNSMPCENPDDPCYCSGPRPAGKPPMMCRNTDQYCLHVPKGILPRLPFNQELSGELVWSRVSCNKVTYKLEGCALKDLLPSDSEDTLIDFQNSQTCFNHLALPIMFPETSSETCSLCSINTVKSKRSVSFPDSANFISRPGSFSSSLRSGESASINMFTKKETTVYMTLFDAFSRNCTSGTQATASINKCIQVTKSQETSQYLPNSLDTNSDYSATSHCFRQDNRNVLKATDVYFFGKKKEIDKSGMGNWDSKTKQRKVEINATVKSRRSESGAEQCTGSVQAKCSSNSTCAQTNKTQGSSTGTSTGKVVSIQDRPKCPRLGVKGDMTATVSHIRIGPCPPCPIHGRDPCQGPACVAASSEEQQTPVKVSTVTNPRRGVFELVVRRINGAPLAKNELMLEWTPAPSRPPCSVPCSSPCFFPAPCRPSKCKMVVCKQSPCRPKYCKQTCKKPCGLLPCGPTPCKKCCRTSCCCVKPWRPCKPCSPSPRCAPCFPSPPCRPCSPPRCRPCTSSLRCKPCSPSPRCRPCLPSPCWPACLPPRCKPCLPVRCTPVCSPPRPRRSPKSPLCKRRLRPPRCRSSKIPKCGDLCSPCQPTPCGSPCEKPCCAPRSSCLLPQPCSTLCCITSCISPCRSVPCMRPCPVGRKRPRRIRSQPRMKPRKKRISPCYNRSKACPVVRCRSVPPPCSTCGLAPYPCSQRKCSSVFPYKPTCCRSTCSATCD